MIRIRIGDSWKHDPTCRHALLALAAGKGRGFSLRGLVDAVRIEVDGIDLTRGRAETSLLDALTQLRPTSTQGTRSVALGAVTVRIESADGETHLLLNSPQGDVSATVDRQAFGEAVEEASREFVSALGSVHPKLPEHRLCLALLGQPRRPRSRPATRPPPAAPRARPLRQRTPRTLTPALPRLSLPPDGLRRMLLRRLWRDTVAPGTQVLPFNRGWLLRGPGEVEARAVDGAKLWSARLTQSLVGSGRAALTIGLEPAGGHLVALDHLGATLLRQRIRTRGPLVGGHRWADGRFVVIGRELIEGADWHVDLAPDEAALGSIATGDHVLIATTTRLLALDPAGRIRWSSPLDAPSTLLKLPHHRTALVGPHSLRCVSDRDGSELWRTTLPGIVEAITTHGGIAVGTGEDGLSLLNASTGAPLWTARIAGEGRVHPRFSRGALWVARRGAGLVSLDLLGRELARIPAQDSDAALVPAQPAPLQLAGRFGLLAATRLHIVDLGSARAIASLEGMELSPHSAALLPNGRVTVVSSDGEVEAWAPSGYLRVPLKTSAGAGTGRALLTGA